MKNGVPVYDYNFLGLQRSSIAASRPLPAGKSTIRFEFAYDGGGPAKGGNGTLYVNGEQVAQGRIERTQPGMFSADETADVGIDLGTPVVEAIGSEGKSAFHRQNPQGNHRGEIEEKRVQKEARGFGRIVNGRRRNGDEEQEGCGDLRQPPDQGVNFKLAAEGVNFSLEKK